jgi:inward rectifier potassium channel
MAKNSRFSLRRHQESKEVGFGKTDNTQARLMNRDGSYNFTQTGVAWYETFNFYHFLSTCSWGRFMLVVLVWYSFMNLIFTGLYFSACSTHLTGLIYTNSWEKFMEVYFFSAQTLTTVGYGRINPIGPMASSIASLEALVGLMSFAVITGLLYARFAKPKAPILYSDNALFAPYFNGIALMFRVANRFSSSLMNMKVQITLAIMEPDEHGVSVRKFYTPLHLERDFVIFFPSSWTLVHPIDEESPLFGLTWEDIKEAQPELMILVSGFDETLGVNVHSRQSYLLDEMVWGAKFVKILDTNTSGKALLNLGRFHDFDLMPVESLVGVTTNHSTT